MPFSRPSARRLAVSVVGVIALSLAFDTGSAAPIAAPAAAKPAARSVVTIDGFRPADDRRVVFVGKVRSPRKACERRRTVRLRQVDQGVSVGKARTTRKGRWRIVFRSHRVEGGMFRAKVVREVVQRDGRRVVCAADTVLYDSRTGS